MLAPITGAVAGVLAPVTGVLAPVTGAVAGVLAPVTGVLTPVTGAVAGVLAPVTGVLAPVTGVVARVLAPVTGVLTPVTGVVARVAAPVTGVLTPVTGAVAGVLAPVTGVLAPVSGAVAGVLAPVTGMVAPVTGVVSAAAGSRVTGVVAPVSGAGVPGGRARFRPLAGRRCSRRSGLWWRRWRVLAAGVGGGGQRWCADAAGAAACGAAGPVRGCRLVLAGWVVPAVQAAVSAVPAAGWLAVRGLPGSRWWRWCCCGWRGVRPRSRSGVSTCRRCRPRKSLSLPIGV